MSSKLRLIFFLCTALLVSGWSHVSLYQYATDDAFIHFRIASHFLDQGQPYFNIDQKVMTSSSALWTIVLTTIFWIVGSKVWVISVFNSVVSVAAALVFLKIAEHEESCIDSVKFSFFGITFPYLIFFLSLFILSTSSIQLMETPLAFLLIGIAILQYQRKRYSSAFFFILAIFVRLELIVFGLVFLIGALRKYSSLSLKPILYICVAAAPLCAYDIYFFQTLIPQTVYAKSQIYSLEFYHSLTLMIFNYYGNWISEHFSLFVFLHPLVIVFLLFFTKASRQADSTFSITTLTFLSGFLIFAAYLLNGVFIFPWYVPLYLLPLSYGILGWICRRESKVVAPLVCLIVLPSFFIGARNIYSGIVGAPEYFEEFEGGAKVRSYREVARALSSALPNKTLMAAEIGAIGYEYRGVILDAAGLASPVALEYQNQSTGMLGDIPPSYVESLSPDLIVGIDLHVQRLLHASVLGGYQQLQVPIFRKDDSRRAPTSEVLRSSSIHIFYRNNLQLNEELFTEG